MTRSPLDIQWETLLMKVKNRRSILDLLNNMPHLQALSIHCDDDNWSDKDDTVLPREDKLVDWLQQYLPLTCTIARDTYLLDYIRSSIR